MSATVNSHQAARLLYFLDRYRALLHERNNPAFIVDPRELQAVERLAAEVRPIINPASAPEPVGMRNSRGHVD